MKTAEDYLRETNYMFSKRGHFEATIEAMSDFAMQEAIEFDKWKDDNYWVKGSDGLYFNMKDFGHRVSIYTPEELYNNLFKQRK